MKTRLFLIFLLLFAVSTPRLLAQDGDAIEEDGDGGDDDGDGDDGDYTGGGPGDPSENDDDTGGDELGECEDPDNTAPVITSSRFLADVTVECFDEVPNVPYRVWAEDACDGPCDVSYSAVTSPSCPWIIVRTWSATDSAGKTKTRTETITVHDTTIPTFNIKSEVTLEANIFGYAVLPDYTNRIKDYKCGLVGTSQTPEAGGKYPVGTIQPVTLWGDDGCNEESKTFMVHVVCEGCTTCSSGSGDPENGSIELDLGLGKLANGESAGYLSLYAQEPDTRVFTPEFLYYDKELTGADTIRDADGFLRQIRSADTLVDIVTNNGYAYSYDIRFYSSSDWGSPDETGLYVPSGDAFLIWQMYAPHTLQVNGKTIADPDQVFLTRLKGGTRTRYEYLYSDEDGQEGWTLTAGKAFNYDYEGRNYGWDRGLKVEKRFSTWDSDQTMRTESYTVETIDGVIAYREVNEYQQFPWGEARVSTTQGEGDSARTTTRAYYEDALEPARYARLAWERKPDGDFIWYDYDLEGRVVMEARAWKDVDVPVLESNALMTSAAVTLYDFTPVDPLDDGSAHPRKPRIITEKQAGVTVSKTYFAYLVDAGGEVTEIKERCSSLTSAYGDANNLQTRTVYYPDSDELWAGLPKSVQYPDGRLERYIRERGSYEAEVFTVGSGDFVRTTHIHGSLLHPEGTGKTTREVSIRPILGEDILRETYVFDSAEYQVVDWTRLTYDERGHLTGEQYANGLSRSSFWSDCCGKESDTDVNGTETLYEYDALGRLASRTKVGLEKVSANPGFPYQADLTTIYDRDAAGNILKETQKADGMSLVTLHSYDLAGNRTETRDTSLLYTEYSYAQGGRETTTIRPGGATEITANYLDGRIKSITGTGVVPRFYEYGVNADGSQWTLIHTGAFDSPQWEKTTTDMLGQTIKVERPGFGGTLLTATYEYNEKGQLVTTRQWEGDPASSLVGVPTLYEYDEFGDLTFTAQDVNNNGVVDLAGPDVVSETQTRITASAGERWEESLSKVYPYEGDPTALTRSIYRSQMAGKGSGSSYLNSESVDIRGNKSATSYGVDPLTKIVTITQNPPDSTVDAITIVRNGLLHSTRPAVWQHPTYFAYDFLGRQKKVMDPRTGDSDIEYNYKNQVKKTTDAAWKSTQYAYDPDSGRRISVTDPLGNTVYTEYDLQGRPTNIWGATYPVAYEYDAYGRMSAMKTWRDTNEPPDVTRWFYDEATGLLTNKVYADGNGPTYEYDVAGRMIKRTWARGVSADYSYSSLGRLTGIDYSDDTPDVSFTYDRMGRQLTITDALGTRTNSYDSVSLELAEEQLPDGQVLARSYNEYGYPAGISLNDGYEVAYAYDDVGRFAALTSSVMSVTSGVEYAYLAQSSLVSGWTIRNWSTEYASPVTVKRFFEPHRDLIYSIQTDRSGNLLTQFNYANDAVGRRHARNDTTNGTDWTSNVFGYNDRSELDTAVMGTNDFGYQYDAIGNRQVAIANIETNLYDANVLNQYSAISNSLQAASSSLEYDPDGNLLSDGTWTYSWDAENRLIAVSNASTLVENAYDYMGRRVKKSVSQISDPSSVITNLFVYDGWNLIQETTGGETPSSRSYVWGLDLSGTLQGAGGVGGLLAIQDPESGSLTPAYDANGNLTDLIDTNGTSVAHYEYSPFGEIIAQAGTFASENPFRFSSKYQDDETGLNYYGYRFYNPELGRWISRDPLGERADRNLYRTSRNNPVNVMDYLGLEEFDGWSFLDDPLSIDWLNFDPATDFIEFANPEAQTTKLLLALGHVVGEGLQRLGAPEASADFKWWLNQTGQKTDFNNVIKSWANDTALLKDRFDIIRRQIRFRCEDVPPWKSYSHDTDNLSPRIFLYLGTYSIDVKAEKTTDCKMKTTFKVDDKYDFTEKGAKASLKVNNNVRVVIHDSVWMTLQERGYGKNYDRHAEWEEVLDCYCQ